MIIRGEATFVLYTGNEIHRYEHSDKNVSIYRKSAFYLIYSGEKRMRIYICIDDTDDLTKSTSTGKIADMIGRAITEKYGGSLDKGVTRHQLLIHEDIDYTSHNSSMCMVIDIEGATVEQMKETAEEVLRINMAASSDPGLCFCRMDQLKEPQLLIAYGKRAQKEVIQKEEAYALAKQIGGTVLEEYGGTGIGVIGALAGIGLRLSGSDGVFRGGKGIAEAGETHTVAEWKEKSRIEQIIDFDSGMVLPDDTQVTVGDQMKTCLVDHKVSLVCKPEDGRYRVCKKKELYEGDRRVTEWTTACDHFQQDNDIEECYDDTEKACFNCLYRRWTADGFTCVREKAQQGIK